VLYDNDKAPYQVNGERAKSTDPQTWTDYNTAKQHEWMYSGIGCVITTPFIGIDFDMVCDPNGKIEPWAQDWIKKLDSYTEVSPSKTGLHIWVKSEWSSTNVDKHKIGKKEEGFGVEVYSHSRYFTFTEKPIPGFEAIRQVPPSILNELIESAKTHYAEVLAGKDQAQAQTDRDLTPSGDDWKLVGDIAQRLKSSDSDKIEAELIARYSDVYHDRNAAKGKRGKLTYFRYTIEKYVKENPASKITPPVFDTVEVVEQKLPEYPVPPTDMLTGMAQALRHGTQLPLEHIREDLKVIAASYIGNGKINFPVMPNVVTLGWHFNLGERQCRKTESFKAAVTMKHITPVRNYIPKASDVFGVGIHKLTEYGSAQFLVKGFESQPRQLLYVTEGNVLATANDNFPAVFAKLTDVYDDGQMSSGSFKNGHHVVENVEASAIICQTVADFQTTVGGNSAIGGGGLARWSITHSVPVKRDDWAQDVELIATHRELMMERVRQIRLCTIIVKESEEAKAIRHQMFDEIAQLDQTYSARLDDLYLREIILAAVFAPDVKGGMQDTLVDGVEPEFMDVSPMETVVTAEMAEFARKYVLEHQYPLREALWPSDSKLLTERMEASMRKRLEKHCLQSDRELAKAANVTRPGSGGWEVYKRAKKAIRGQEMKCVGTNRKGKAVYCHTNCETHAAGAWLWE
jgi:hypothetical protein